LQGSAESSGGSGLAAGSVALTGGTGGLSIEVSGPTLLLGVGMTVHGAMVSAKGASNLVSQNGRVKVSSNTQGPSKNCK
jgi:hypothetical protein